MQANYVALQLLQQGSVKEQDQIISLKKNVFKMSQILCPANWHNSVSCPWCSAEFAN